MLEEPEKEILNNALYISINYKKFKEYVKTKIPDLYQKIYLPYEYQDTISKEQIEEILNKNGFKILYKIKQAEEQMVGLGHRGKIYTIEDHIEWMIKHYNATHTEEPEIQEVDSWRPNPKKH